MGYIITDGRQYICSDASVLTTTCNRNKAKEFDSLAKAGNVIKNMKKTLKQFGWKPQAILSIVTEKADGLDMDTIDIEDVDFNELVKSIVTNLDQLNYDLGLLQQFKYKFETEQSVAEKERNDIEHKLEFSKINACDGYKLAKMLQDVMIKRRECKDGILKIDILTKNITLTYDIEEIAKRLENMDKRLYAPRILTELFGA